MDSDAYELLALAARYWFILLAALIVLRGWRASVEENRSARLFHQWLGSTGAVGELLVLEDGQKNKKKSLSGARYPIGEEALIGSGGMADIRIHHADVRRRHVWMNYRRGAMMLTPCGKAQIACPITPEGQYILRDGDQLTIGSLKLMLVFYNMSDAATAPPATMPGERNSAGRGRTSQTSAEEIDFWE